MEKDNRISKEFILDVFYDIDNPKIEEPLVKKIETSENIAKQISEKNSTNNVTEHKNSKNDFTSHDSKHLNSESDSSNNDKVQKISENDSSSHEDLSDIPDISSDESKKKKKKKNSEISSIYKENQNYIRKRKPLNLTLSDVEAGSDDQEGGNDVKFDLRKSLAAKDFPKRKSAKLINYKAHEDENLSESD